jgi:hypothetical protein
MTHDFSLIAWKLHYKPDLAKVFPKKKNFFYILGHLLELLIEIWLFGNFP